MLALIAVFLAFVLATAQIADHASSSTSINVIDLASRYLRPLGHLRFRQDLLLRAQQNNAVVGASSFLKPIRMASSSSSSSSASASADARRALKADEILATVETATHEPMTTDDVRRARTAESGLLPLGLNGETEANPTKRHFPQTQVEDKERLEEGEPLSRLSKREEKEWNHMAEGMEYYHTHFRMEFDQIYEVRTGEPLLGNRKGEKRVAENLILCVVFSSSPTENSTNEACPSRLSCAPLVVSTNTSTCITRLKKRTFSRSWRRRCLNSEEVII